MDKQLAQHDQFMTKAISDASDSKKDIQALIDYNEQTIQHFQHERLIHLLVTFFFAGLLLLFVIGYFVALITISLSSLTWLLLAAITLLLITELFYIRHYYILENGTQKLYRFSKELYEKLKN